MAYTIKPSIGMLPLDDIDEAMEKKGFIKKLKNDDIYDVTTERDSSGNITKEGIKNPALLAVCSGDIDKNGNIERGTVDNAKKLNGIDADNYLKGEDKEAIQEKASNINKIYSEEVQALRDELYHLKSSLIRTGHLNDTSVADGFIEGFKENNIKYASTIAPLSSIDGENITPVNKIAEKGDWIVVKKDKADDQSNFIGTVEEEKGLSMLLDIGSSDMTIDKTVISNGLGSYNRGTYSFSKVVKNAVGAKENITLLNDDSNITKLAIKESNTGYAAAIKIPNRCAGFLTNITINMKAYGNPGGVRAYVFKGNQSYINQIAKTNGLSIIESDGNMIGKSSILNSKNIKDGEIIFDFKNYNFSSSSPNASVYPEILGEEYCFIIAAESVTQYDYYEIEFGQKRNASADLETNNTSYKFVNKDMMGSNEDSFVEIPNMDMLYMIKTKNKEDEAEMPFSVGLYKTNNDIKLSNNIKAAKATLTLEVNREGNFITSSSGLIKAEIDAIKFRKTDGSYAEQTVISAGDTVIIGNEIATVKTSTVNSITIDKNIYVNPLTKIYRCGYKCKLKTKLMEKNNDGMYIDKDGTQAIKELNLVGVIPNSTALNDSMSDRLIFEAEVEQDQIFNCASLQIAWNSKLNNDVIYTQALKGNDYVGRIYNMSLAFSNKG